MKNGTVARIFYEIADMLEIKGDEYRSRAYRNAARSVETMAEPVEDVAARGELETIPGVGGSLAEKIEEIVKSDRLGYHEKLKRSMPVKIDELMSVEGVGPKKVKLFYNKLKVRSLKDLEKAAKNGRIRKLEGMGEKSEQHILDSIEFLKRSGGRTLLGYAIPTADGVKENLKLLKYVDAVEVAGSIRRMKETIGDIDVLVVTKRPSAVMEYFTSMRDVEKVVAKGDAKSSVRLKEGMSCDLRVIDRDSFGSALLYFTGSKDHNVALRRVAIKHGLKLSEYGLFKSDKQIAGRTEKEVYGKLGMEYIPPEMRENTGEIELAGKKKLPKVVGYGDMKGDLQMHSNWSDGVNTIEEMAKACKAMGYEYMCMTDHAGRLRVYNGMTEKILSKQGNEIDEINKKIRGITILKGAEVDITVDGSLSISDKYLKELDVVVASVHSGMTGDNTKRIAAAMENEHVDIIGHPTGRLIQKRQGYTIDIDRLADVSKRTGTVLEIDAYPNRLDLGADNVRRVVEKGCNIAIDTDSHSVDHLQYMRLGIATARRGWVQKKDVINAMPLKKLKKYLKI